MDVSPIYENSAFVYSSSFWNLDDFRFSGGSQKDFLYYYIYIYIYAFSKTLWSPYTLKWKRAAWTFFKMSPFMFHYVPHVDGHDLEMTWGWVTD